MRLLKDDGSFILVKPDTNHLYELKKVIYDNPYLNEVENIEIEGMYIADSIHIDSKVLVKKEDLNNLFMMTPYYNTSSIDDKEKLNVIDSLEVTFSFVIDVYKKV